MFSLEEKQKIAQAVEDVLLSLDHKEMPKENPHFALLIQGKAGWNYSHIKPNWVIIDEEARKT